MQLRLMLPSAAPLPRRLDGEDLLAPLPPGVRIGDHPANHYLPRLSGVLDRE